MATWYQALVAADKFVNVPALDAEAALAHRVGFHRQGGNHLIVQYLQEEAAAAAAVRTSGVDGAKVHGHAPNSLRLLSKAS